MNARRWRDDTLIDLATALLLPVGAVLSLLARAAQRRQARRRP